MFHRVGKKKKNSIQKSGAVEQLQITKLKSDNNNCLIMTYIDAY